MTFNLCKPVTWSDIISFAAAIFTLLAVIVAVFANKRASHQLKDALVMQEQSKNVQLLEKRVTLADSIQKEECVSEIAIEVLFNSEIVALYSHLKFNLDKIQQAEHEQAIFFEASNMRDSDGYVTNPVRAKIEEYLLYINREDYPASIIDEFKEYCSKNTCEWSESGLGDDRKNLNYAEIWTLHNESVDAASREKDQLLTLIKKNISDSIQPVAEAGVKQ